MSGLCYMFKLIDKLRKKPERKREAIVLGVSLSITLIIAIFWLVAFIIKVRTGGISLVPPNLNTEQIDKSAAEIKDSWSSFIDNLNKVIDTAPTPTTTTATIVDSSATTSNAVVPEDETVQ